MTAEIKVTRRNGSVHAILLDEVDYDRLGKYHWYVQKQGNVFYAHRHICKGGRRTMAKLHREVLQLPVMDKRLIDHINGDGLDNRRENLRPCSDSENSFNTHARWGVSKYKGVYWNKAARNWRSHIMFRGIKTNLGGFASEVEAAKAYDRAAMDMFGCFANTNGLDE